MKNIYSKTIPFILEKLDFEKLLPDKGRRDQAEKLLTSILEKKLIASIYGTERNRLAIDENIIQFENLLNVKSQLNEQDANEFHARFLQILENETAVPEDDEESYNLQDVLDDSLRLLNLDDEDLEKDFTSKFYKLFAEFSLLDAPENDDTESDDEMKESVNEASFLELFNAPQVRGVMSNDKVKGLGEWVIKGVSSNRLNLSDVVLIISFMMLVRQKYRDFQQAKNRLEASNTDFKESTDLMPHSKKPVDDAPEWMTRWVNTLKEQNNKTSSGIGHEHVEEEKPFVSTGNPMMDQWARTTRSLFEGKK